MSKIAILREFWAFLKARKKWWLMTMIVALAVLGALIIFTQSSVFAPFIYSLF